ncbi:MAG: aminodeoxychorismate synthase component I, partial [Candidatus Zixiibacteriota bacterium]
MPEQHPPPFFTRTGIAVITNCVVDSKPPFSVLYGMIPQVVLHHAAANHWLAFENPLEVVTTASIDEVLPLLRRLENRASQDHLWAAGFVSYEASPAFDQSLAAHSDGAFPKLWFGLYQEPRVVDSFDNANGQPQFTLDWQPTIVREQYCQAIKRIRELIALGDTYQVNFTTRLRAKILAEFDALSYFQTLTCGQHANYAAFLDIGDFAICSASPELFFNHENDRIETRPMKGTVRRGRTSNEDAQLSQWLFNSEKNRAENVMIVDMMRNDLGKIAHIGSVKAPRLFRLERYPTVWQMVSDVTADTNASFSGILSALFPPASVTGAPKPRTVQIISELESAPRRIYTGTIGFVAPNRRAQFSVAIRTVLIDKKKGVAEYGVGGGIVWDSQVDEEYHECLTKAQVLAQRPPEFSLLETMRWSPVTGCFLLEKHLKRLADSADYFDFSISLDDIRSQLENLAASLAGDQRVRLLVSKSGTVTLERQSLSATETPSPLRLRLARHPVDSGDAFLYHKTTYRRVYEDARSQFQDCDDVILWNRSNEITETCLHNIVIRKPNGSLITPPIRSGLLAGTYRELLLEQGAICEEVIALEYLKS